MYVIKHKRSILFLNNLFGKTNWQFGDHVSLNSRWQFGVLLLLSAYVYDPTYIGPHYNKKNLHGSNHVSLNTRWQFGVLLSLSAYVSDPAYIGPQYNKKSYMVAINMRYIH
jgi:hypothetical protein